MTPSWIWPRAKQVRRIYYDGLQAIKSNARDYDIQLRQGRSGKDSLTGLLQVHSSVGWLPVSFQNLHIENCISAASVLCQKNRSVNSHIMQHIAVILQIGNGVDIWHKTPCTAAIHLYFEQRWEIYAMKK